MEHTEQASSASRAIPVEAETAAIRQTVTAAEKYQSDVDPFIALHTAEAIIVNIAGRRVLGRETIQRAMSAALEGSLSRVLTKTEVEDVRFVRPDVAIVSCIKHVIDQRTPSTDEGVAEALPLTGSLTYLVVKERGEWRIALAQTTPINT
jgi:uncharacterized protein (TIGR02246 family)